MKPQSDPIGSDAHIRRRVAAYCHAHASDFESEVNDLLRRNLLKSRITVIVVTCLVLTGLMSALKTGNWILSFSHMPTALMFGAFSFLSARFSRINQRTALYCAAINKVIVLESVWAFYVFHKSGQLALLVNHAPSIMMMVIFILNFHTDTRRAIFLSLSSSILLLGSASWLDPDYVRVNISGFLIGASIGFVVRSLIFTVFRYKFYFSQQETILRTHAYKQLEKIIYPHQRTLIESGAVLEETMPVGWGDACVLAFDVIESTKIKSPNVRLLLQNVLKRCHAIMMENYSPEQREANAYRIKEMGDGFLCSVGYPFRGPSGHQKETLAITLAQRFIQVFHEEASRLASEEQIYCAVGIASGGIDAFYPQSHPKEYDIYGLPLILATRYEAARKELFLVMPRSSIIILQPQVYEKLDPQLQGDFTRFDLLSFKIRDDNQATCLFYQAFDGQGPRVR